MTAWFSRLPSCLYTSASLNSLSSVLVMMAAVCACASSPFLRLSSRLGLAAVMLATCVSNSVSAYGALELRSEILQQNFLTVDISKVLNKYIEAIVRKVVLISFHECSGSGFSFYLGQSPAPVFLLRDIQLQHGLRGLEERPQQQLCPRLVLPPPRPRMRRQHLLGSHPPSHGLHTRLPHRHPGFFLFMSKYFSKNIKMGTYDFLLWAVRTFLW